MRSACFRRCCPDCSNSFTQAVGRRLRSFLGCSRPLYLQRKHSPDAGGRDSDHRGSHLIIQDITPALPSHNCISLTHARHWPHTYVVLSASSLQESPGTFSSLIKPCPSNHKQGLSLCSISSSPGQEVPLVEGLEVGWAVAPVRSSSNRAIGMRRRQRGHCRRRRPLPPPKRPPCTSH
jgi:hypothetical protein